MDERRKALAQCAVTSIKAREGEDVGEWAKRLARDSVATGDIETAGVHKVVGYCPEDSSHKGKVCDECGVCSGCSVENSNNAASAQHNVATIIAWLRAKSIDSMCAMEALATNDYNKTVHAAQALARLDDANAIENGTYQNSDVRCAVCANLISQERLEQWRKRESEAGLTVNERDPQCCSYACEKKFGIR